MPSIIGSIPLFDIIPGRVRSTQTRNPEPFSEPASGFRSRAFGAFRNDEGYIFSSRLALPLNIFTLSSSDSGMSFIHSTAGGFITNGQSTANRM